MKVIDLEKVSGIKKRIGELSNSEILLTTDSRLKNNENTFVALKGERFDAFDFIEDALKNGATTIITTFSDDRINKLESFKTTYKDACFLMVEDSLVFLQDSAKLRIDLWKDNGGIVFGLTGSNGKTTTKEMLFSLTKSFLHEAVICTQGNLNNHIGVPLTIFSIKDHHRFAIIEMGTNHFGEIEALCEIAKPDYGYITNIGHAHTEFLKDLDGVLEEKSALNRWIEKNGKRFYRNDEDEKLKTIPESEKVCAITKANVYDFESDFIRESYNRWNVQAAAFILENIFSVCLAHELKNLRLPENKRAQWINVDKVQVYLDAYNANPTSMSLAIKEFAKQIPEGKKAIYIIGDMNELGDKTQFHHEAIAEDLNLAGANHAIFLGRFRQFYENSFRGAAQSFENLEDFRDEWLKVLKSYDYIFLKASRSLQLEKLIDITM